MLNIEQKINVSEVPRKKKSWNTSQNQTKPTKQNKTKKKLKIAGSQIQMDLVSDTYSNEIRKICCLSSSVFEDVKWGTKQQPSSIITGLICLQRLFTLFKVMHSRTKHTCMHAPGIVSGTYLSSQVPLGVRVI